jgi:broad specificity phosphatase PhoE
VSAHLTLVCHAPTAATSNTAFPADEPLDERGRDWVREVGGGRLGRVHRARCAPAPACRETAAGLGLAADLDPALRDWALGRWRGQTLDEVGAAEPDAVRVWLSDPDAAPHGGERLTELLDRVAGWLSTVPADGPTVAVTHPAVVRAAVIGTLGAPAAGFWRIDIAPLTATELRGRPGRWSLRSTGRPLRTPSEAALSRSRPGRAAPGAAAGR